MQDQSGGPGAVGSRGGAGGIDHQRNPSKPNDPGQNGEHGLQQQQQQQQQQQHASLSNSQQSQAQPRLKIRLGGSIGPSKESQSNGSDPTATAHRQPTPAATPLPSNASTAAEHPGEVGTAVVNGGTRGYHGAEHDAMDIVEDHQHLQQQAQQPHTGPITGKVDEVTAAKAADDKARVEEERRQQEERDRQELELQLQRDLLELPQIAREHLVPLTEIVRRVVARSFSELQSLVEILPAKPDSERKRSIIEYVISTRRQIVKLLVLLRWSRENIKDTERSINLIAFLQRQNYQLERAVEGLKGVRTLLSGARVRNYDIATAIDVLTQGSYTRLPAMFKDSFVPPPTLTSADVVALLHELESVIRYRLQLHESIPLQMLKRSYRIHDGRVTFTCPGLFKAAFTLGGDSRDDQWYLVDFSFDLEGRDVQTTPSGVMRDHILQVVNDTLARCAAEEKTSAEEPAAVPEALEEAPDQSKVTQEEHKKLSLQRKGQAFGRAYTVLQDLCLNYQMELLHYHAVQTNTTPTIWQSRLAVSLKPDRSEMVIRYSRPTRSIPPPSISSEESLSITITDKGPSTLLDSTSTNSPLGLSNSSSRRSAFFTSLAQTLSCHSVDGDSNTSNADEVHGVEANLVSIPQPVTKRLVCIYTSTPVYYDTKNKRYTSQATPSILNNPNNPPRREQKRQVDLTSIENGKTKLKDLELVLGDCFDTAPQAPPVRYR